MASFRYFQNIFLKGVLGISVFKEWVRSEACSLNLSHNIRDPILVDILDMLIVSNWTVIVIMNTLSFYVTKDSVIINDCLLLSEDPTILFWCKIKIVFCLPKQNCIMLLNILFSRCLIASSHQAIEHITWIKMSVEKLHQPAELSP